MNYNFNNFNTQVFSLLIRSKVVTRMSPIGTAPNPVPSPQQQQQLPQSISPINQAQNNHQLASLAAAIGNSENGHQLLNQASQNLLVQQLNSNQLNMLANDSGLKDKIQDLFQQVKKEEEKRRKLVAGTPPPPPVSRHSQLI